MEIAIADKIELRPINTVKPYVRNPRKNDKTVELLCKIIPKVGFNVPIVVDEKGVIVKGHARFTAAIRLGLEKVPCIVSHADEETIKADRIADNKISEFSEWVNEELMHEVDSIDLDFDFTELGFPTVSFDDIPTAEDFAEETPEISDEERKKLYQEFLEQQAKEQAEEIEMATVQDVVKAQKAQKQVATPPPKYYKCVCENCGHVMFVKEGDICDRLDG